MALAEFVAQLEAFQAAAQSAFASAADATALEAARIEFLGAKSGQLKTVQKQLGSVAGPDKPAAGKRFNEAKTAVESAFAAAEARVISAIGVASNLIHLQSAADGVVERAATVSLKSKSRLTAIGTVRKPIDITLPRDAEQSSRQVRLGHLHPLTQTIEELKDIMGRLGFTVAHGPEIEDEWHNFEALNIPASHPARDPLENFYLSTAHLVAGGAPLLLRSQTSTVQIRVMESTPPPVRIISLGRVYRPDTADATHYPMFHQIEGLLIDRHVTMADLKSVLRLFAASYLGTDVHIRFRPSFFPFTEPSVEVDMSWHDSTDGGIRWVEMGGAGMVDPNVLRAVGYDPEVVSGFAFGLGVERVCARRHGVSDIREFYKNDVRFLHQF